MKMKVFGVFIVIATVTVYAKHADTSLLLQPEVSSYLLRKDSNILLNCTLSFEKKVFGTTQIQLMIGDDDNKTLSSSTNYLQKNFIGFYGESITYRLSHDDDVTMKHIYCYSIINDTSILAKDISVVFEHLPVLPSKVSLIYDEKMLIYYSTSIPSLIERQHLKYEYSMKVFMKKCNENMSTQPFINQLCTIHREKRREIPSYDVLFCYAENLQQNLSVCKYEVILSAENRFGNIRKSFEVIKTLPAVAIENVYVSDHDILLVLRPVNMDTEVFDVRYTVRYYSLSRHVKTFPAPQKGMNILKVDQLAPNTCYRMAIKFQLYFEEKLLHSSNWTNEEVICTKAKVISIRAEDLHCWKRNITKDEKIEETPTVELSWKKPMIPELEYGRIDSYKLTVEFVSITSYPRMTYAITSTLNEKERFVSQMDEYKTGGYIRYRLHLCNNNGCSEKFVECSVHIPIVGESVKERAAQINIILACTIPALCMLTLVIGSFVSYYRKKEIQNDLNSSFSSSVKGNTNLGASVSSRDSSLIGRANRQQVENESKESDDKQKKLSSSSITSESEVLSSDKTANADKHVNDNVLSVNRTDIARLFINTFSPATKSKIKSEPLLNGGKTEPIASEQIV